MDATNRMTTQKAVNTAIRPIAYYIKSRSSPQAAVFSNVTW
jgi:hypothetical protein